MSLDLQQRVATLQKLEQPSQDDIEQVKLGYAPQLRRGLGIVSSTATGFNTLACLIGVSIVYGQSLSCGGPVVIFWGNLVAVLMMITIGFCFAELSAAYPVAGSVYYWSAQNVPVAYAPFAGYVSALINYFGCILVTAIAAVSFSGFLSASVALSGGVEFTQDQLIGVAASILIVLAAINVARIDEMAILLNLAGTIHVCSIVILVAALTLLPRSINSPERAFFQYYNGTGFDSVSYVSAIALVASGFTTTGYDAPAHMAEETHSATRNSPYAIIGTCVASAIGIMAVYSVLLLATLDVEAVLDGDASFAIINVFILYLPHHWALALSWLILVNMFLLFLTSVGVTARMCYALARDNGLPFSSYLATTSATFKSPVAALFFSVALAMVFLPLMLNPVALGSFVGLSGVLFNLSYALPIFLKLIFQPKDFPRTSFDLGPLSVPMGIVSCMWLCGVSVLAFLPTAYPYTLENMNWSPVVAAAFIVIGGAHWILVARHHFKGPPRYVADLGPISASKVELGETQIIKTV